MKNAGDLGEIIYQNVGVCRELTCFGHLVTGIYGIDTTIAKGYPNNQNSSGRRHVWLKDNESSLIVDFNKHKKVFNEKDYDHYQISEQTLVKKFNENP
ncbi:MAG: hypothetical protein ABEJ02_01615 [Candidatus Paceibacteria bacterium]